MRNYIKPMVLQKFCVHMFTCAKKTTEISTIPSASQKTYAWSTVRACCVKMLSCEWIPCIILCGWLRHVRALHHIDLLRCYCVCIMCMGQRVERSFCKVHGSNIWLRYSVPLVGPTGSTMENHDCLQAGEGKCKKHKGTHNDSGIVSKKSKDAMTLRSRSRSPRNRSERSARSMASCVRSYGISTPRSNDANYAVLTMMNGDQWSYKLPLSYKSN